MHKRSKPKLKKKRTKRPSGCGRASEDAILKEQLESERVKTLERQIDELQKKFHDETMKHVVLENEVATLKYRKDKIKDDMQDAELDISTLTTKNRELLLASKKLGIILESKQVPLKKLETALDDRDRIIHGAKSEELQEISARRDSFLLTKNQLEDQLEDKIRLEYKQKRERRQTEIHNKQTFLKAHLTHLQSEAEMVKSEYENKCQTALHEKHVLEDRIERYKAQIREYKHLEDTVTDLSVEDKCDIRKLKKDNDQLKIDQHDLESQGKRLHRRLEHLKKVKAKARQDRLSTVTRELNKSTGRCSDD